MAQTLIVEAKAMQTSSTKYLPLQLNLRIGAPVVLTFNLEQRAGLCNGSRGYVYDIIPDDQTPNHYPIVLVQVPDYKGPSFVPNVRGVIPVTSRTAALNSKRDGQFKLTRTVLPIRLGFAATIHKIQGQTCDTVVFNPSCVKSSALAYVALSRVRSRMNMYLAAPMTRAQLAKSDQARLIDDAETKRVELVERESNEVAGLRMSRMKVVATLHNKGLSIPQHLWYD